MHAQTQVSAVGRAAVPSVTVADVTRTKPSAPAETAPEYLRSLMLAAGFRRQADLAKVAGVSHGMLSRWLDGTSAPSVDGLRRIAPHLGVRLGDLMIRFGLATQEELGTIGNPAPVVPMRPVESEIHARLADPTKTARHKRALENHLEYSLELFDEVVAQVENSPREPRMRRRDGR